MREGKSYDVSHLDAVCVEYYLESRKYKFLVSYSHHCFTKTVSDYNECESWSYPYPKDSRHFHEHRYKLSHGLPEIIAALGTAITYHGRRGNYAVCDITDEEGKEICYQVIFSVFKVHKKYRMHISSAYVLDKRPKIKKVRFARIVQALAGGRRLPTPQT